MPDVKLERIVELADASAASINNKLKLGVSDSDYERIKLIIARAIAKAVAEQRES